MEAEDNHIMMVYTYFSLLAIGLVLSFFTLFVLSKNDFVLLRRGVMQKQIFDTMLLSLVVGFVFARIFYILDTFQFVYLNPIQFFHLILYPGLSIFGFLVGVFVVICYAYMKKKALLRALDLFSISFYWIFLMSLVYEVVQNHSDILRILHFVVSFALFVIGVHLYRHFSLRDGGTGLLMMLYVSCSYFLFSFSQVQETILYSLSFSQIISITVTLGLLSFFIFHQFVRK